MTSLTQVSHDPRAGEAAEVQGVLRVAPDGSRAYFVARGVLSEAPNAQGAVAVKGADNLYVYDGRGRRARSRLSGISARGTVVRARSRTRAVRRGSASDTSLWAG